MSICIFESCPLPPTETIQVTFESGLQHDRIEAEITLCPNHHAYIMRGMVHGLSLSTRVVASAPRAVTAVPPA